MYVDSHCHINFPEFKADLAGVRDRMHAAQVNAALVVCVTLEEFADVRATAAFDPHWYCSVGVHPDYKDTTEPTVEDLLMRAADPKVIAIGETGLDYFREPDSASWQIPRFETHIQAARQCNKPLIVHTRAASTDTIRILTEQGAAQCSGVMHCFTESWEVAQAALDLGFYISFSGIVTFKNASELREVARKMPLDRLLIETDSPYLAPVPYRGRTNEPSFVPHVAAKIAEVRGVNVSIIAEKSTNNFFNLFNVLK
jgi:TatD DNase family protein